MIIKTDLIEDHKAKTGFNHHYAYLQPDKRYCGSDGFFRRVG